MNLPSFQNYGRYSSDNYGVNTLQFFVGGVTLWFSYKTVVAFRGPGYPLTVSENLWGRTTGKHLNWIDSDKSCRLPRAEFEAKLRACLRGQGIEEEV